MQQLTEQNLASFLARHHHGHDGVIQHVELVYVDGRLQANIQMHGMDQESASGWSALTLILKAVTRFQVHEDRSTNVVMSSGLQILFGAGTIYLDLSPITAPDAELAHFEESTFAVQAQALWVTTVPLN